TPAQIADWAPYLLPALLAPALATLLTDAGGGRAACIGIAVAHAVFVPMEAALPVFLMCLLPSFIKHRHIAKVRRRSQLLVAFAQAAPAQFIGALMLLAYTGPKSVAGYANEGAALGICAALTVFSVLVSFVATIVLLPLFEHIFAACSNIKLNNYSDLEHPLLRILSNDAPGTYQHAMKVADLAFEAAEKIGVNPLLCRVGAYFHDIGKIDNPRYFGENLGFNEQNPHDKLPPSMSASILEAHIKQGLAHADANTFPPELRRMIKEHHGTTVKEYFFFKAREQAKLKALESGSDTEKVDDSSFRYDSDKPTTKETGILLLADSVEAATRSLENITPQFISNKVEDIVKNKIDDGQFDECPLSFTEISTIKKSFIVTLQHMLHHRIAYPKDPAKDSTHAPDNHKPPAKSAH
ncbi:MAG: HDIG domain-containing protein, partial [Kiritimatiellaeota bacterium]|nr:HDIG domain-containing protein [Kiritimatiellota bacterium]